MQSKPKPTHGGCNNAVKYVTTQVYMRVGILIGSFWHCISFSKHGVDVVLGVKWYRMATRVIIISPIGKRPA